VTYADFNDGAPERRGAMSQGEMSESLRSLWKGHNELKSDFKNMRHIMDQQSVMMTEMNANVRQIAASVASVPNWSVAHDMRLKKLEEDTEDQEERIERIELRQQCHGCKNDEKVQTLQEFRKVWEPRLWMGFGALVLMQIAIGAYIKMAK
jgi:hypothetical protein